MKQFGVIAGAATVGGAAVGAPTLAAPAAADLPTVIHGADWRCVWPTVTPGTKPPHDAPRLPHGRLVDEHGTALGTFAASVMVSGGAGSHLHQLMLVDGTISAVGPATLGDADFAVLGGTGRYSRVTGSYRLHQQPAPSGGTAQFVLDIHIPEV